MTLHLQKWSQLTLFNKQTIVQIALYSQSPMIQMIMEYITSVNWWYSFHSIKCSSEHTQINRGSNMWLHYLPNMTNHFSSRLNMQKIGFDADGWELGEWRGEKLGGRSGSSHIAIHWVPECPHYAPSHHGITEILADSGSGIMCKYHRFLRPLTEWSLFGRLAHPKKEAY